MRLKRDKQHLVALVVDDERCRFYHLDLLDDLDVKVQCLTNDEWCEWWDGLEMMKLKLKMLDRLSSACDWMDLVSDFDVVLSRRSDGIGFGIDSIEMKKRGNEG